MDIRAGDNVKHLFGLGGSSETNHPKANNPGTLVVMFI